LGYQTLPIFPLAAVHVFRRHGVLMTWDAQPFFDLGWNCVGLLAITAWTGTACLIMFGVLKYFNLLRVDHGMEFKGMDQLKHGEAAYPAEAWVESQYAVPEEADQVSVVAANMFI